MQLAQIRLGLNWLFSCFPIPVRHTPPNNPERPHASHERRCNRLASNNNPEMRSALAEIHAANAGVKAAKAAYLPDLG